MVRGTVSASCLVFVSSTVISCSNFLCSCVCARPPADKEEMKEMQKQMAENDPQKMLSNLFGNKQKDDDDDD